MQSTTRSVRNFVCMEATCHVLCILHPVHVILCACLF